MIKVFSLWNYPLFSFLLFCCCYQSLCKKKKQKTILSGSKESPYFPHNFQGKESQNSLGSLTYLVLDGLIGNRDASSKVAFSPHDIIVSFFGISFYPWGFPSSKVSLHGLSISSHSVDVSKQLYFLPCNWFPREVLQKIGKWKLPNLYGSDLKTGMASL